MSITKSYNQKFIDSLKAAVEELAKAQTEKDWLGCLQLAEKIDRLQFDISEYEASQEFEQDGEDAQFYSGSGLTFFEAQDQVSRFTNIINNKWKIDLDAIRVYEAQADHDELCWTITYIVKILDNEHLVRVSVANGVAKLDGQNEFENDEDFSRYVNFEHYKLIELLKQ